MMFCFSAKSIFQSSKQSSTVEKTLENAGFFPQTNNKQEILPQHPWQISRRQFDRKKQIQKSPTTCAKFLTLINQNNFSVEWRCTF
jgi:hypothetical protein